MESVNISRVFALTDSHELLDFVHFAQQVLILAVQELDLSRLALGLLLAHLVSEFDVGEGGATLERDIQAIDLLVTQGDLSFEQLDLLC